MILIVLYLQFFQELPLPPPPEEEEEPSMKIFNENGDPTVIIVEIEIAEALVKSRPTEELFMK